ncbi:MAG: hypothetical protein WDO13_19830 [Verrucomicrobiota bacterium]
MKAGNDVASAIADKIKAVDVLKTPGLDDPALRARFETYLSLKEVDQARIDEYFGKMKQISAMLQQGPQQDLFGAWELLLYSLSEYEDLDGRHQQGNWPAVWKISGTPTARKTASRWRMTNCATISRPANHNADLDAADPRLPAERSPEQEGQGRGGGAGSNVSQNNLTNSPILDPHADPAAAEAAVMPTIGAR